MKVVSLPEAVDLVPDGPTRVWGRDDLGAGDMWNSNSVVAWLLTRVGLWGDAIGPPCRGRAPGWRAGVQVARRELGTTSSASRLAEGGPT